MIKWLIVVGVVGAIYFFFIKKKPAVSSSNKKSDNEEKKDEVQSNDMVECSTCSVYCEIEDAILSNGKYYCSSECVDKA